MRLFSVLTTCALLAQPASAAVFDVTIDGSDAIFLAGRTDLTIPPASDPWPGGMIRHPSPTPEEILETLPPEISISGGDTVQVSDPAVGGISFFNGFGGITYGPEGNPADSNLSSFGGISGYLGTQGALVGVFLDATIPVSGPPPTLDFRTGGIGTDFTSLSPDLGQIFFIGDGRTSGGTFQSFVAPSTATRLFLGIPDGFSFVGQPGAYDDNDGGYRIRVGVNEAPVVPLPAGGLLLASGLALFGLRRFLNG